MAGDALGLLGVPLAVIGGALRVSPPYLFVSLGECLTEKSGRVNLGLEGTLIMGAMSAYGVSYLTGSPWLGVLAAGGVGMLLGGLHAFLCQQPRVNDIAIGIALMIFGVGLAFFLGKPLIQPSAPRLPAFEFGNWSDSSPLRAALQINVLFAFGIGLAFAMRYMLKHTRWGLLLRVAGESADSARAMGYDVSRIRLYATACGGFFAGIGGSFLSLYYPGSWNEGLSSGQGLMAVALVIFARWDPVRCLWASLLFGSAGALGPALQSVGISGGYHLLSAAPYILTLAIMILTSSAHRTLAGQPAESCSGKMMTTSTSRPALLRASGLGKTFGTFRALDDVSLELAPGSVHALLGENGAGKSTLVKCIMGYHRPDAGHIQLGAQKITPRNPRDAQALGLGMVYQHFTLVANMTVAENLVLSRTQLPLRIDWKRELEALAAFMSTMPFKVDLRATVRTLAAGEKQKLEILKQLYLQSRIVILDEPTSVLTPAEADEVLGMLQGKARNGELSILIITHKFREVLGFCDEVTVLRRGKQAGRGRVSDLTPSQMAEMMMGSATQLDNKRVPATNVQAPRLRVHELTADDDMGVPAVCGVSFEVCSGEIVGVAAVAGNGQEELVEVLAGQRLRSGGEVQVHGKAYGATRAQLHDSKVRCLPEDPLRNACVPNMSVAENMAFRRFDKPPFAIARWALSHGQIRRSAEQQQREYGIRAPSMASPIATLSGGNVQRAVLARELSGDVDVLIAANPCMGLDFAAVSEIHARIRKARDQGAAVLLVSADLDEVLALADRILVMSEGRVVYETRPELADITHIGKHMAGHETASQSGH